jgi:chitinase
LRTTRSGAPGRQIKGKGLLGMMIWEMSGDTGTLMGAVDTGLR